LLLVAYGAASAAQNAANPHRCTAAAYRQFDFWLGDWDAFEARGSRVEARNRVDPILNGCAIRERYAATDGLRGESISIYDAAHGVWHQTWVTNRGTLLVLAGRQIGRRMILTGPRDQPSQWRSLIRGVWIAVPGGVRETATVSSDGGRNWRPLFDIVFRPHRR